MEKVVFKIGFDTEKYVEEQTKAIKERVSKFEKLYLEFGGKLCYDLHAARTMPGYRPTAKMDLLKHLGDIEIIYCVNAKDVQKGKVRGDTGLSYDYQAIKDIHDMDNFGLKVNHVVITRCEEESLVLKFKKILENNGLKVYLHQEIEGYPHNMENVLKGYENQPFIETDKKLILVTGAGGSSGKMATCLTQIYNERRKGTKTGYAKFETFPIWNLALDHPINDAYEASTADLLDINMLDPFHEEAYGAKVVNYNRDIENFDILISIMERITGEKNPFGYKSPTDMGVNMAAAGIVDDGICRESAKQEIIFYYFRYLKEKRLGIGTQETLDRMAEIMEKVRIKEDDRSVVLPAREAAVKAKEKGKGHKGVFCGAALELSNGEIITGKNSPLLHAGSAAIMNAIKVLANIPDPILLISEDIIKQIKEFKVKAYQESSESLDVEQTLFALAISAATNPTAKLALEQLPKLKNTEMHVTHIPKKGDEVPIRKLGINLTTDAQISGGQLYLD